MFSTVSRGMRNACLPSLKRLPRGKPFSSQAAAGANPSKDCIYLAFAFGMCGTFASCYTLEFREKVLVFKSQLPTPERFALFTSSWFIAGLYSYMLLWSKPYTLAAASSSAMRCGMRTGLGTSVFSLGTSCAMLCGLSLYLDYTSYRQSPQGEEFETGLPFSAMAAASVSPSEGGPTARDITESIEESMNAEEPLHVSSAIEGADDDREEKRWEWTEVILNMYDPCRIFVKNNAAIWLLCGMGTSVIVARSMSIRALSASALAAHGALRRLPPPEKEDVVDALLDPRL